MHGLYFLQSLFTGGPIKEFLVQPRPMSIKVLIRILQIPSSVPAIDSVT